MAALSAGLLHGAATRTDVAMPTAALAAVEAAHVTGPILNDYGFGGYLAFAGVPPFIDGRAELYGDGIEVRMDQHAARILEESSAGGRCYTTRQKKAFR